LALLTLLLVSYAEFLVFVDVAQWPEWIFFATGFIPFLTFLALLPAAVLPNTTRAALFSVLLALLVAPLVEVVEVVGRRFPRVIDPFTSGTAEYGRQVIFQLLTPALLAALLGALLRRFRAHRALDR
jgi:hypothetical protein